MPSYRLIKNSKRNVPEYNNQFALKSFAIRDSQSFPSIYKLFNFHSQGINDNSESNLFSNKFAKRFAFGQFREDNFEDKPYVKNHAGFVLVEPRQKFAKFA